MGIRVRLKDIQTLQLLVENCQRLKLFGLVHLDLEPVFYLHLPVVFKVAVSIVEMSRMGKPVRTATNDRVGK